jgi:hypothetical protein
MAYGIFDETGAHHFDCMIPREFGTAQQAQTYLDAHAHTYVVKLAYHVEELPVTLHSCTVNGKGIAYSSETIFLVQVGKNRSAYWNRFAFKGELHRALQHFDAINVSYGYKKRLLMPSCSKNPVIARQFS